MTAFRIHFADGEHLDTDTADARSARACAEAEKPGVIIKKIKQLKEAVSHAR
ncbi:hypothetical protein [Aminobacter niigataensis]|uniref:hypothetical protein n=1 Tax=Aminobacter niigataensis TaxID=83265 RepID=UPI00298EE2B1|nr:hypothetical protein [Aminobacter niigataensis]